MCQFDARDGWPMVRALVLFRTPAEALTDARPTVRFDVRRARTSPVADDLAELERTGGASELESHIRELGGAVPWKSYTIS